PADVISEQAGGGDLGGAVGQSEADRLVVEDAGAELLALERPGGADLDQAVAGTDAARGDVDALLDEPLAGQLEAAAELAEDVLAWHRRLRERELGMAVREVVREVRVIGHLDAGRVLVDEEEGRAAVVAVDGPGEHDEVARDVAV